MNKKQKMSLLTIGLCLTVTATSIASGAPTSQFGFSGWPYRQSTQCGGTTRPANPCTVAPEETALPTPTREPEACPTSKPEQCPTQAPAVSEAPLATQEPTPTPEATATREPDPTAPPPATPTPPPTSAPTAPPTPTKVPETTAKPVIPTLTPSTDDDYTTGSVTAQEENAFLLLNADRTANGRGTLTLDPSLCALARLKSTDMYQNNYFAHTSPTLGSAAEMLRSHGYGFNAVGENIAHHATVEKAQAAFMSSAGHRQNILGSQWTKVGIGVCYDSQGFVYVTQLFVR